MPSTLHKIMKKDWITILILPLLVSFLTILFEFGLNNKSVEVSFYERRNPTASPVEENGVSKILSNDLNELSVSTVELRNTGDFALKDFKLKIRYKNTTPNFELLQTYHKTNPEFEFGQIKEIKNKNEITILYEILNPNESSIVQTSIRGDYSDIELYSKSENLCITENKYAFEPFKDFKNMAQFSLILFSFLIGIALFSFKQSKVSKENWAELEAAWKYYQKKKKKK